MERIGIHDVKQALEKLHIALAEKKNKLFWMAPPLNNIYLRISIPTR